MVLLTARACEQDKLQGLRIGIDDYITKPFSSAELQMRIANLLHNSRARTIVEKEEEKTMVEEQPPALKNAMRYG